MAETPWMLYGAYGYTGELVAREAARRGLRPILAGRRQAPLERLAEELDLSWRHFPLDNPDGVREGITGAKLVLHCAGPFVRTAPPMMAACLAAGAHYLDITGEIAVLEGAQRRSRAAREAGVVLMPGVGFDVVPSDCLAARLALELPGAMDLELAFTADGGRASRGTLKSMVEGLPRAGAVRRAGKIVPVPPAWDSREIDFPCGRRWAMTIPWGDVATAFHTTGIPNVRVYTGVPRRRIRWIRLSKPLLPLLATRPVKSFLRSRIDRLEAGPSEAMRRTVRTYLWGRVTDREGHALCATLTTPEAYGLTAVTAVECAARVMAGGVEPGARTPAGAFGFSFVESFPGVEAGPVEPCEPLDRGNR